jgi:two-component system, OmpR family, phosphate regulon response regulator PhoB
VRGNVLIVQQPGELRDCIAASLERAGFRARFAANVGQAEAALAQGAATDVLLLDRAPPDEPALAFVWRLRAKPATRHLPIILLSKQAIEDDKIVGLEAGADDYIVLPCSDKELAARIVAVLRRRTQRDSSEVLELAGLRLEPATRHAKSGDVVLELQPVEYRLLHFLMAHPGRIYTRSQLLREVWGDEEFMAERSVDVHVARLRKALACCGHDRLIETVRGAGYRFASRVSL